MKKKLSLNVVSEGVLLFLASTLLFVCVKSFLPIYLFITEEKPAAFDGWMYLSKMQAVSIVMLIGILGTLLRVRLFSWALMAAFLLDGLLPAYQVVRPVVEGTYLGTQKWWADRNVMEPLENFFMNLGFMSFLYTSIVKDWVISRAPAATPESLQEVGRVRNRKWGNTGMLLFSVPMLIQAIHGWRYDRVLALEFPGNQAVGWYFLAHLIFAFLFTAFTIGIMTGGKSREGYFGKAFALVAVLLVALSAWVLNDTVKWPEMVKVLPWSVAYSSMALLSLAFLRTDAADKAFRWRSEQR